MLKTKVIFLGADAVGKTTLLYKLKLNENIKTIPTIGFNVEEIEYKNKKLIIWDIGGGEKIRHLWKHYFDKTNCIIYIMNISDKERLDYYIECFNILIKQHKDYRNIPIIIFGNKFNDKIEFEPEEMLKKSNLPPEICPHILKGNAVTGEGLPELLDYIYNNIEFKEEEDIKEKPEDKIEEKPEDKNGEKDDENIEKKQEYRISMFGLNDAGKTKILYLLKLGEEVTTIPTIGFNVEIIDMGDKNLAIFDVGGHKQIRVLWHNYLNNINGLIWVYDINNSETFEESQNELKKILDDSQINQNTPLLIYANKCDINNNGNTIENFVNGIQDYLTNRPYFIKECNIKDLDSYKEGLDWLYNNIN